MSFLFLRARLEPLLEVVELERVGVTPVEDAGLLLEASGSRVSIGGGRVVAAGWLLLLLWTMPPLPARGFFACAC